MRAVLPFFGLFLSVLLVACNSTNSSQLNPKTESSVSPTTMPEVGKFDQSAFAWKLFAKLSEQDGNLFFSPYSISTAIAMTSTGAKGETLKEMLTTLNLPESDEVHSAVGSMLAYLSGTNVKTHGYEISTANALWGQKGYPWLQPFLDSTKKHYGASLTELDIAGETEKSRQTINSWVEKETRNKIRDLLKPGTLQPDNRLVLTNAIYFKGNWAEQFDAKRTLPNDFHLQDGKSVKVPMMNANLDVRFFQTPEMKMVELPYQGKAISMLCIMPTKKDGLPELQKKLTAETMNEWTQKLNPHVDLRVSLPKFKIESQFGLAGVLSDLGMKSAFNPNTADFSGMTREERLFISAVIHKAFVEVNEEGTEAAAATAVLMAPEGIRLAPPEFVADRPFVFVIRENKNGAILFVGRLNQPN